VPVTQVENVAATFSPGEDVHFCPGAVGGAEWNSPAYDPQTNLILVGEVDWCHTATPKDLNQLRSVALGQPWAGMATWNPFWMFGREGRMEGHWAGWVYAVDADTGVWKWRLKSNYPIVGAVTPTAGRVVFFGDLGGNFYALDAANGQKLWGQELGGAIAGGVITYTANGAQKIAVASGFTMLAWPTKIVTAKIEVLGVDSASASR
jgi:alcohol dehydrogenase (cytochrome c)